MAQGSPINEIFQMRQQGLSNNQIIQNLQRSGYSNTQIFDAMNQADTKMAVEGIQPNFQFQQNDLFVQPEAVNNNNQQNNEQANFDYPINNSFNNANDSNFTSAVKTEELIEAIIEEKWEELIKEVNKIIEWKNKVDTRISEIEIKLQTLRDAFSDLNKAVIGKVNDYDKHILEIGSDLKAMEKVFSKILPALTENVNELSRISQRFKNSDLK
ncbi:MAG: hypothetical protein QW757_01730 [Candidatus Woesearchaeota archaeon]